MPENQELFQLFLIHMARIKMEVNQTFGTDLVMLATESFSFSWNIHVNLCSNNGHT